MADKKISGLDPIEGGLTSDRINLPCVDSRNPNKTYRITGDELKSIVGGSGGAGGLIDGELWTKPGSSEPETTTLVNKAITTEPTYLYTVVNDCGLGIKDTAIDYNGGLCYYVSNGDLPDKHQIWAHSECGEITEEEFGTVVMLKAGTKVYATHYSPDHVREYNFTFWEFKLQPTEISGIGVPDWNMLSSDIVDASYDIGVDQFVQVLSTVTGYMVLTTGETVTQGLYIRKNGVGIAGANVSYDDKNNFAYISIPVGKGDTFEIGNRIGEGSIHVDVRFVPMKAKIAEFTENYVGSGTIGRTVLLESAESVSAGSSEPIAYRTGNSCFIRIEIPEGSYIDGRTGDDKSLSVQVRGDNGSYNTIGLLRKGDGAIFTAPVWKGAELRICGDDGVRLFSKPEGSVDVEFTEFEIIPTAANTACIPDYAKGIEVSNWGPKGSWSVQWHGRTKSLGYRIEYPADGSTIAEDGMCVPFANDGDGNDELVVCVRIGGTEYPVAYISDCDTNNSGGSCHFPVPKGSKIVAYCGNNGTQNGFTFYPYRVQNSVSFTADELYPVGSLYFGTGSECPIKGILEKSGIQSEWTRVGTRMLALGDDQVESVPVVGDGNPLFGEATVGDIAPIDSTGLVAVNGSDADAVAMKAINTDDKSWKASTADGKSGLVANLSGISIQIVIWQRTA